MTAFAPAPLPASHTEADDQSRTSVQAIEEGTYEAVPPTPKKLPITAPAKPPGGPPMRPPIAAPKAIVGHLRIGAL